MLIDFVQKRAMGYVLQVHNIFILFFMVNSWFRNLMVLSPRISRVKSARKLPSTTWPSAAGKVR